MGQEREEGADGGGAPRRLREEARLRGDRRRVPQVPRQRQRQATPVEASGRSLRCRGVGARNARVLGAARRTRPPGRRVWRILGAASRDAPPTAFWEPM